MWSGLQENDPSDPVQNLRNHLKENFDTEISIQDADLVIDHKNITEKQFKLNPTINSNKIKFNNEPANEGAEEFTGVVDHSHLSYVISLTGFEPTPAEV